ncbi:hypothetical protein OMAG_002688 [Candidatus Omnitrophus magneticus]|uniref:Protein containing DUF1703 n=1 Tax=Candidatus Omnitrophus magneticus TaxID=1609969 RepID=A0A0F0CJF7_9BACT|nr:hypothetical protein OMAG_002688 [Candidatus Omnitrophus magneticus]
MCWLYNSVISSFVHVPKRIDSALILKGEPVPNDASLGRTFVLELKLKRDSDSKEDGLDQISRYLDTLGMTKGYLILFEIKPSSIIPWETRVKWEDVIHQNKEITIVEM